jgi:hypothetical protein
LLASGGTVIAQARLAGAEVGVLPGGNLVQSKPATKAPFPQVC